MRSRNVPPIGARYWLAISIASVFGANMGDFVSHVLHLGHVRGLPPLALAFAAALLAERRAGFATEAFYWTAIVILRTAATNLADLATHDLRLGYPQVIAGLAVLLLLILGLDRLRAPRAAEPASVAGPRGVPTTDLPYWLAMLVAGTLGTALGDGVADDLGLGVAEATIVLGAVLAGMLCLRSRAGWSGKPSYWACIIAVRSAGTTLGDFLAGRNGLHLGLPVSTACTGALLVGTLLLWREQRVTRLQHS